MIPIPFGFPMETKYRLKIDYHSQLYKDAPEEFMKVMVENNFERDLIHDMNELVEKLKERRRIIGEDRRTSLAVQLFTNMGLNAEEEKKEIKKFSNMEDYLRKVSTGGKGSIENCERKQHFRYLNFTADPSMDPRQKEAAICYVMKVHKRLSDLARRALCWVIIEPNQRQTKSNPTPAADNNSNPPNL